MRFMFYSQKNHIDNINNISKGMIKKMEYITENIKTPILKNCDVLVIGGGIAGAAAALAAARNGANVILIERQYMLGGLATSGLVTIYLPLCDGLGHQVSFGISEELLKLSIKYGYEGKYPEVWLNDCSIEERKNKRYEVQFNAQFFAIALEDLLVSAGVKIYFGTSVCGVIKNNKKINAVIIENSSGRSAISVSSVVDATGDATICKYAEAKCSIFNQKNVLAAWYYSVGDEGYKLNMLGFSDIPDNEKKNMPGVTPLVPQRFEGLEAEEINNMVHMSHKAVIDDILKYKKNGIERIPVTLATIPQIRMTRRINGIYTLKHEDCFKNFHDSIGMISNWRKSGPVYQIPFRALYGKDVDNLITAGRCISSEDAVWDLTRVIPAELVKVFL